MSHHLYPNHPLRGVCGATVGGSEWGGVKVNARAVGIAIPKPLYCFIFEGRTPRCVLPAFALELLE